MKLAVLVGAAVTVAAAIVTLVLASSSSSTTPGAPVRVARATTTTAAARPVTCTVPHSGTVRLAPIDGRIPVVIHIPPHLAPGAPLVLGLPGAGQTARDFAQYTGYSKLADRKAFVVAYPTATGSRPSWNISGTAVGKPDDVAYLRGVIVAVLRATCADPRHVGVTGVSNGGGMSARLACDAADLVSAAAPVAGGYGSLPDCHPGRAVPILEIHGTGDHVVPYAGKGASGYGAVSRFLAQWRGLDHCPNRATQRSPSPGVTELRWGPCASGSVVLHERIAGAEHGWPGEDDVAGTRTFSSTATTWAFLSAHGA